MLLDIILARWWRPVTSSETLDLLYRAMRAVTYRRIIMAIKTASKVDVFVDCCLFACRPGGHRGNTEQGVTRWRRPVASEVALDMPHWAMPSVLPQRRGDTEQGFARWRRPVSSEVALDMPHWAMPSVLPQRTAVAIEMATNGGAFVCHC
jgi:hypothetical protein